MKHEYTVIEGHGGIDLDCSYNVWEDGEFIALFTNKADAELFAKVRKEAGK